MHGQEGIDEMRKATGTHPSAAPCKRTRLWRGCEKLKVSMVDWPANPYKAIFSAVTATWGDDDYKDKWGLVKPEARFKVVLAALTGNTLPQALESFSFTWKVYGGPRHMFDQHARARVGSTFYSVGCRDNSKLDASMVAYSSLYDMHKAELAEYFGACKRLYGAIISGGTGSWQSARAVLPMCYHHPYYFSQNYLALKQQCSRRMMFCEEEFIVGLHWLLRESVAGRFPLLANYLRPACDAAHECLYAKSYSLSNMFGCLFKGCGRWPRGTEYASWNSSCTDVETLVQQGVPVVSKWVEFREGDYGRLAAEDKRLFEST